jgi:hypothetical protein
VKPDKSNFGVAAGTTLGYLAPRQEGEEKKAEATATIDVAAEAVPAVSPTAA